MTWRVEHGDCLERMRLMADASLDSIVTLEVHAVPFNVHVARVTKANNIVQRVGIVRVLERADRPDMVNVWAALRRVHVLATSLARIVISKAGGALQGAPVWTVVFRMTATPRRVILALAERIAAVKRAEGHAADTLARLRVIKDLAAVTARFPVVGALSLWPPRRVEQGGFPFRCVGVGLGNNALAQSGTSSGVVTGAAAKDSAVLALHLSGRTVDFRAAHGAGERGAVAHLAGTQAVGARTRASGLASMSEACAVRLVGGAADLAFCLYKRSHASIIAGLWFIYNGWDAPNLGE